MQKHVTCIFLILIGRLIDWLMDWLIGLCVAVSQALKENSYPFLALIVLRDNRMTVVSRIEGPIGQLHFTLSLSLS